MPSFIYLQSTPVSFVSFFSLDGADVTKVESTQWVVTNPENGYKLKLLGVFDKSDPNKPTGNIKSLEVYAPDGTLVVTSLTNFAGVTLQGFRSKLSVSSSSAAGYLFSGDDEITGSSGNDDLDGQAGLDKLYGGDGEDDLYGTYDEDQLYGGDGADTLQGGEGTDLLYGGDGDDEIVEYNIGPSGDDLVDGGAGNDGLSGGAGNDTMLGGDGSDGLSGGYDQDTLTGGAGDDYLDGGEGDDLIVFAAGDGGASWEEIDGGSGFDTVRFDGSISTARFHMKEVERVEFGAPATVAISQFIGNGTPDLVIAGSAGQNTLSLTLVTDDLYGDPVDPHFDGTTYVFESWDPEDRFLITGTAGADTIRGPQVAASLDGAGGDDFIMGAGGADRLTGGAGADTLIGGKGDDTYVIDAADGFAETAGGGLDTILTAGSFSLAGYSHFENLGLADAAAKTSARLTGNALANTLTGDAGSNVLSGGLGKDTLNGGKGKDFFLFDTKLGKANVDTILSYSVKDDTIRLENAVFKGLKAGKLSKDAFVIGKRAQDAEDRIVYDKAKGALYFDPDGLGGKAQVQFATLDKNLKLAAADFIVI